MPLHTLAKGKAPFGLRDRFPLRRQTFDQLTFGSALSQPIENLHRDRIVGRRVVKMRIDGRNSATEANREVLGKDRASDNIRDAS